MSNIEFTVLDYSILSALHLLGEKTTRAFPKACVSRLIGVTFGSERVNTVYRLRELGLMTVDFREADKRVYYALTETGIGAVVRHIERSRELGGS